MSKEKPRILIVTPEITYLPEGMGTLAGKMSAKAGGMADVSASLTAALYQLGADVHVALPHYRRMFHVETAQLVSDELRKYKSHLSDERIHLAEDRCFYYRDTVYDRGDGTEAPSYDDFTVDGNRLYALAHASVDVFELDDATRTTETPNDCGVNGIAKTLAKEADAAVFAGHVATAKAPDGIIFRPGRFGNCFGAYVFDWAKLPDGRYAVAYGEAGLVFCDAKGNFVSEPLRGPDGLASVFAAEVICKDGRVYVKDGDSKVGDGQPWSPEIKVKGGNSAFYSIGVGKGE